MLSLTSSKCCQLSNALFLTTNGSIFHMCFAQLTTVLMDVHLASEVWLKLTKCGNQPWIFYLLGG